MKCLLFDLPKDAHTWFYTKDGKTRHAYPGQVIPVSEFRDEGHAQGYVLRGQASVVERDSVADTTPFEETAPRMPDEEPRM